MTDMIRQNDARCPVKLCMPMCLVQVISKDEQKDLVVESCDHKGSLVLPDFPCVANAALKLCIVHTAWTPKFVIEAFSWLQDNFRASDFHGCVAGVLKGHNQTYWPGIFQSLADRMDGWRRMDFLFLVGEVMLRYVELKEEKKATKLGGLDVFAKWALVEIVESFHERREDFGEGEQEKLRSIVGRLDSECGKLRKSMEEAGERGLGKNMDRLWREWKELTNPNQESAEILLRDLEFLEKQKQNAFGSPESSPSQHSNPPGKYKC